MKKVNSGFVVCCPKCGMPAGVSSVSMQKYYCSNKTCSTRFTGWVVNGFVITFETDREDSPDSFERFETCKDKLIKLRAFQ